PFAQILVRGRVRLNIDAVVTHVAELFPRNRLPTAQTATGNTFRVEEHGEGVAILLQDWPGDLVLRFPPIIERIHREAGRYVLFASLPREQILHRDDRNPVVLQCLHLCFKSSRCDLSPRCMDLINQTMVTKNNRLRRLIDNRLRNLGRCRYRWRRGCRSRRWGCPLCGLRVLGSSFVLLAHRKIQCQKQWNNCKSDHHKGGKALSITVKITSDFLIQSKKQMNAWRNVMVSFRLREKLFCRSRGCFY